MNYSSLWERIHQTKSTTVPCVLTILTATKPATTQGTTWRVNIFRTCSAIHVNSVTWPSQPRTSCNCTDLGFIKMWRCRISLQLNSMITCDCVNIIRTKYSSGFNLLFREKFPVYIFLFQAAHLKTPVSWCSSWGKIKLTKSSIALYVTSFPTNTALAQETM